MTEDERNNLIDKAMDGLSASQVAEHVAGLMGNVAYRALKEGGQKLKADLFDNLQSLASHHHFDALKKSMKSA